MFHAKNTFYDFPLDWHRQVNMWYTHSYQNNSFINFTARYWSHTQACNTKTGTNTLYAYHLHSSIWGNNKIIKYSDVVEHREKTYNEGCECWQHYDRIYHEWVTQAYTACYEMPLSDLFNIFTQLHSSCEFFRILCISFFYLIFSLRSKCKIKYFPKNQIHCHLSSECQSNILLRKIPTLLRTILLLFSMTINWHEIDVNSLLDFLFFSAEWICYRYDIFFPVGLWYYTRVFCARWLNQNAINKMDSILCYLSPVIKPSEIPSLLFTRASLVNEYWEKKMYASKC